MPWKADPTLDHQIVLRTRNGRMMVSCNCRRVPPDGRGKHDKTRKDSDYYDPMPRPDGMSSVDIYNTPEFHNLPFDDKWKIRV
jgi:hypothetical protein